MLYICNAFSLSMLPGWAVEGDDAPGADIRVEPIADPSAHLADARERGQSVVSAVGHADTAAVFSSILGETVTANRVSVELTDDDELLVGQYIGPRLQEGATELPAGARIRWMLVTTE